MANNTKVITGPNTIFSYLTVLEPKTPLGGGTPKYSVSLIIPKSDTATIQKISMDQSVKEKQNFSSDLKAFANSPLKIPQPHIRTIMVTVR